MDDFPNAAELRAQMDEAKTLAAQSQLMEIRTHITQALERGRSWVYVDDFQPGVKEQLQAMNYRITFFPCLGRNQSYYEVSW